MTNSIEKNNKQIAKNTAFMYFRMLLVLGISLYTSRVVLNNLGIDDFGIYNLINGVIVSFSFISNSLTSSAQRYMSYALGTKDEKQFNSIFSTCVILFTIVGLIFCLILEPIGIWLINNKLEIPQNRLYSANFIFHIAILNTLLSFIRIPYGSAIISCEKMSFYAYLSIIESFAKLLVVYLLVLIPADKLILYSLLLLAITIAINIAYVYYCKKNTKCILSANWNVQQIKGIFSFSSWSLYEGMANIAKTEIVGFLLNIFNGLTLNAAVGIAKQVNMAVNSFISNFQTAFRPQITKSYAAGEIERVQYLIYNTSKLSGIILLVIALPICYNIDFLLKIWLGVAPQYASSFSVCLIGVSLIEAVGGPFWMTGHAVGDIKWLQLISGSLRLISIPVAYVILKNNCNPSYVFVAQVIFELMVYIYRIIYIKNKIQFSIIYYLKSVLLKLVLVASLAFCVIYVCCKNLSEWYSLCASSFLSIVIISYLFLYFLISVSQRKKIFKMINSKISSLCSL